MKSDGNNDHRDNHAKQRHGNLPGKTRWFVRFTIVRSHESFGETRYERRLQHSHLRIELALDIHNYTA